MEEEILILESINILDTINDTTHVLEMKFKEKPDEKIIMFENHAIALDYLNQKVIVTFRKEFFQNEFVKCVNNLTRMSVVSVIEKENNIKLFSEGFGEMPCTCIFSDISEGSTALSVILYCVKTDFRTSKRARWLEFTCLDRDRKVAIVRQFDPEEESIDFGGKFIQLDMWKNKYGFNTQAVNPLDSIEAPVNPQIEIAKKYIMQTVSSDEELVEYINKTKILDKMSVYDFDEEIERGYEVVRLAMEIYLAKELVNLSPEADIELMLRAAVLSRGYVITHSKNQKKSIFMQNILNCVGFKIGRREEVIVMLDKESFVHPQERKLLQDIKELANTIAVGNRTYLFDKIK